jgi:drug/metabolite transporter (DMT)-like permease
VAVYRLRATGGTLQGASLLPCSFPASRNKAVFPLDSIIQTHHILGYSLQLRHWLWLILAQSCWAASYIAMKIAGGEMPVGVVVFLRYGIVSLVFLAALPWVGFPRLTRRDLRLVAGLGVLNFTLAPTLQIASLRYTQAIDVSVLIALEPMMTVLVAALVLRERPNRATIFALLAGTMGMLALSGVGFGGITSGAPNRLLGNVMFTLSLLCESSLTVAGRTLGVRYPASQVIFAMKLAGFLAAGLVFAPAIAGANFGVISVRGWASVAFMAVFSSIFAYIVWYRVIRVVPVAYVALSLFVQPIVGSALGYLFLGEQIGMQTIIGAVMVCVSLAWWQLRAAATAAKAASVTAPPGT